VRIFTEGGGSAGFGHMMRCTGLYDAFVERGLECEFVINGDPSVSRLLEAGDAGMSKWDAEDSFSRQDIAVVDSYLAPSTCTGGSPAPRRRGVMIDDYGRLRYPRGI